MSTKPDPTPRDRYRGDLAALVAGFVSGQTLAQTAHDLGVSVSTVQRRHRDPIVLRAIAEARRDSARRVAGQLGAIESKAVQTLADLLDDPQPRVRLQAAIAVLTSSRVQRQAVDDLPVALAHTTGDDPRADQALAQAMAATAWEVSPAGMTPEPGDTARTTQDPVRAAGDDHE